MALTLTAARHRARGHLRFGWYRRSASAGWVNCPDCRAKVDAVWHAWSTPGEIGHSLREALALHLRDECSARST